MPDPSPTTLSLPLDQLPDPLPIPALPPRRGRATLDLALRPPGSKSLTNRALLLAALASGTSTLRRPLLDADDAERMLEAITLLGATVEREPTGNLHITGVNGRWRTPAAGLTLNLNNAGTATRFLSAAAILSPHPITIDGNERMRQRPIGELVDALTQLGAQIEFLGTENCPPIRITPPQDLPRAITIELQKLPSSQFVSALLLIAPFLPAGLTLRLGGEVTSASYIAMTAGLLDRLGATVRTSDNLQILRIGPARGHPLPGLAGRGQGEGGSFPAFTYDVEPDASSATYFWAAAALIPNATVRILGLGPDSLQGDAEFPAELARMGAKVSKRTAPTTDTASGPLSPALRGEGGGEGGSDPSCLRASVPSSLLDPSIAIHGPSSLDPILADLANMPDTAMTLAAVACFAGGQSILRGLGTLRVKETDRIAALETELKKVGVNVETNILGDTDAITLEPPRAGIDCTPLANPVAFETYDDHRMAMSLALIGLRRPGISIKNPRCVAKTYPTFWQDFARLYG